MTVHCAADGYVGNLIKMRRGEVPEPYPHSSRIRRRGDEPFVVGEEPIAESIGDFWSWMASDLMDNTLRGRLAEFIVGTALGCIGPDRVRVEWDAVDLRTADGVLVEVKSTAHIQSWGPSKPSSLQFSIRKSRGWDPETNTSVSEPTRSAHVYVFCVHTATDPEIADPLLLDQWEFHVVPVTTLNDTFGNQRNLRLSVLCKLPGVVALPYSELAPAIHAAAEGERPK